jgi:hypothetical protein
MEVREIRVLSKEIREIRVWSWRSAKSASRLHKIREISVPLTGCSEREA